MKGIFIVIVSVALLMVLNVSCTQSTTTESGSPDKKVSLETMPQKYSYIMGYNQGRTMKMRQMEDEIDLDAMAQGIKDGLKGTAQIEEKDMQKVMQDFYQGFKERQEGKRKIQGEKNKVEGEKFLLENAKKPGVITTPSGLQYMVVSEGTGPKPQAADTVVVHYTGTFIDGSEFDSSYKRGQPAKFPLNRVIPAWTEGVQLMSVGSKFKFFAPPNLAYGESGQGMIAPHAVLIFDVELQGIEPPQEQPKPAEAPAPDKKQVKEQ